MNYDASSLYYDPVRLSEFFQWLAGQGFEDLHGVRSKDVRLFFSYLAQRKNKRTGQVLSLATLRNYLTTINRFARYLHISGQGWLEVDVQLDPVHQKVIIVLSPGEVQALYHATDDTFLGMRDRAMLAVFYGCGLRRNEALHLHVADILSHKNQLYVRKAKGRTDRFVPMIGRVRSDILHYLHTARPMMVRSQGMSDRFFIGMRGGPLGGSSMYERLKRLLRIAGIEKKVSLHTLRHSIATHLLAQGMALSEIATFLGHQSLESTQIYTHIQP